MLRHSLGMRSVCPDKSCSAPAPHLRALSTGTAVYTHAGTLSKPHCCLLGTMAPWLPATPLYDSARMCLAGISLVDTNVPGGETSPVEKIN